MTPPTPAFDVYERDGFFFVRGLSGGWAVGGYRDRTQAECYALNLKYMFEHGWRARELEFKHALGLGRSS